MIQSAAKPLFDAIREILAKVELTQNSQLQKAAKITAESLLSGGILHVFGTGHSHMMAEELFLRAGGLTQVNAILDPGLMLQVSAMGSTQVERLQGYTPIILDRYDIKLGDVMLVASNSGRNAGPIEAALYAHERGIPVIALTSAESYKDLDVRHPLGKHLAELADVVIDTCVPEGDAAVSLPGVKERICPVSTIIGATLVEAFVYEIVQEIIARGQKPNILVSANVDSDQDMRACFDGFRARIRHL
jgi:uncharacterized phosphosugar-binding protein